jgi:nicotinate-nucleotide pyrophosphorylase (carboxylating)
MKRTDSATLAHLYRRLTWEELDPEFLRQLITMARAEDLGGAGLLRPPVPERAMDVTTAAVPVTEAAAARLVAREPLRVCGLRLLPLVFEAYGGGVEVETEAEDGVAVEPGTSLAVFRGSSAVLLQAERVLLNFLQHMSGIASETARYREALGDSPTRLLDTRKTTPGWRMLEKYAVGQGGGWNHRLGLFDRVMLKDNHLAAEGATSGERLGKAVQRAREAEAGLVIEVEVDRLEQIPPVLEAGADVILLDNFSIAELGEAVRRIAGRAYTEASGGVSLETLPDLGALGLDFVSCGAITHQSRWRDLALDWEPGEAGGS